MAASRTQKWWAAGAAVSIVLLAASWFLLISPRRADAAALDQQVQQVEARSDQLRLKTAQLKAAFAEVPRRQAELQAIKLAMPSSADIPQVISDLEAQAARAGVTMNSVAPGSPTASATGTSPGTGTPAHPLLVAIPLSIQTTGDYFESALFLKTLQSSSGRSILVSSIQLAQNATTGTAGAGSASTSTSPSPTSSTTASSSATGTNKVSMTVTAKVFVLLDGSSTLDDVKKAAATATAGSATAKP